MNRAKPAAADFLGGAKSRLLPSSIPFRYFTGAVVFHVLFWLGLALWAEEAPNFVAGPGRLVAVLHLLTLGVFVASAFGAAFQLLPVATKQPLGAEWPARLVAWLLFPGVLMFAHGMAMADDRFAAGGASLSLAALLLGAALLADNLRRARGMAIVVAHAWAAVLALLVLAVLGTLFAFDQRWTFLADRLALAAVHAIVAIFGFMGLLTLGFSYVLVPMFALSPAPPARAAAASLALCVCGLLLAIGGALLRNEWLLVAGIAAGLAGVAQHLRLMAAALGARMRKRLGPSFLLVRIAWICLPLSLLLAGLLVLDLAPPRATALLGALALLGWLLTFLLAMLQRIVPFLAAMHATAPGRGPPLVSALTQERPLDIHRFCHGAALVLVLAGIAGDWVWLVRIGAVAGAAGALAFAWFFVAAVARIAGRKRAGP
jgi:hypothetical protein